MGLGDTRSESQRPSKMRSAFPMDPGLAAQGGPWRSAWPPLPAASGEAETGWDRAQALFHQGGA